MYLIYFSKEPLLIWKLFSIFICSGISFFSLQTIPFLFSGTYHARPEVLLGWVGFRGCAEGQALVYNPVTGAAQPRPPVSLRSPREDSKNALRQVPCLQIWAGTKHSMRARAEERSWPSHSVCSGLLGQTEHGRHLHLTYLHFCTVIFSGDWTWGDYGCCELHRKATNASCRATCVFPFQARADKFLLLEPSRVVPGRLRCTLNYTPTL